MGVDFKLIEGMDSNAKNMRIVELTTENEMLKVQVKSLESERNALFLRVSNMSLPSREGNAPKGQQNNNLPVGQPRQQPPQQNQVRQGQEFIIPPNNLPVGQPRQQPPQMNQQGQRPVIQKP